MTVGKLKEYLNVIDDNVEIEGLRLYCENGFSIQSKTLYMDNSQRLEELEKIKTEIDEIVESEMKEDVLWSLGLRYSKKIIDKHITELKGEQEC